MKMSNKEFIFIISGIILIFTLVGCQSAKTRNVITDYSDGPGKVI